MKFHAMMVHAGNTCATLGATGGQSAPNVEHVECLISKQWTDCTKASKRKLHDTSDCFCSQEVMCMHFIRTMKAVGCFCWCLLLPNLSASLKLT